MTGAATTIERSPAVAPVEPAAAPSSSRPDRAVRAATWALPLLAGAWLVTLLSRGWFYSDDVYNLTEARSMGFGWTYLTRDLFGHVEPGFMALAWLVAVPGHAAYRWAVAETAVGFVAMVALAGAAARALGASRRAALAAMALSATSAVWVQSLWWASALNAVWGAAFALAFLWAHARWLDDHRARHLLVASAALAVSLSLQEGSIAFLWVAVGATLAWSLPGSLRDRVRGLWDLRAAWLAYAVPVAACGVLWKVVGQGIGQGRPSPAVLAAAPFVTLLTGFLPAQLGISLHHPGGAAPVVLAMLAVAAAVLVRWLRATGRQGWWPVAIVGGAVAIRGLLTTFARFAILGWTVGSDQRYLPDLAWVAPVAFAVAWSRRSAPTHTAPTPTRASARRGALGLVVAGVAFGLLGQITQAGAIGPSGAAAYRRTFTASYRAALAAHPGASVLDVPAGPDLAPALLARFSLLSSSITYAEPGLRFNDPAAPTLLAPDANGRVHPVQLATATVLELDHATHRGLAAHRTSAGTCWSAGAAAGVAWVPLAHPLPTGSWALALDGFSTSTRWDAHDPPRLVAGRHGTSTGLPYALHPARHGRVLLTTTRFAADRIGFTVPGGSELCVASATVERIEAR